MVNGDARAGSRCKRVVARKSSESETEESTVGLGPGPRFTHVIPMRGT